MSDMEALARLIDPASWTDIPPGEPFADDPDKQAAYLGFFDESVSQRRQPSLDAGSRILLAGWTPPSVAERGKAGSDA